MMLRNAKRSSSFHGIINYFHLPIWAQDCVDKNAICKATTNRRSKRIMKMFKAP